MKKVIALALIGLSSVGAFAQSGTNSPYSQFGLGTIAPQSTSFNRGMAGVAYGFHEHNQVNYQNPASYASVDSLSFIFDAGLSIQLTNFNENGTKRNAKNADIEYVVASFRAFKHFGVSFGLVPYTNIGYDYSNTANVNAFPSTSLVNATYTNTYSGKGGIHAVYLGAGYMPFRNFSFGFNIAYLWGNLERNVVNTYSDAYVKTLSKSYNTTVRSYKLDLGMQYTLPLSKKDELTIGATYSLGHKLNGNPVCLLISNNSQTAISDTTQFKIDDGLKIPHTFGAGLMYNHSNKLKLGVDYQLQKWSSLEAPRFTTNAKGVSSYGLVTNQYKDRHKVSLGADYTNGDQYRGYINRMHFRAGVSYATPYLKINGKEGPKELSASIGLGLPLSNGYSNRGMLNISAEWVNQSVTGMIKENMFRINVGLTFNERWFAKFKVE